MTRFASLTQLAALADEEPPPAALIAVPIAHARIARARSGTLGTAGPVRRIDADPVGDAEGAVLASEERARVGIGDSRRTS